MKTKTKKTKKTKKAKKPQPKVRTKKVETLAKKTTRGPKKAKRSPALPGAHAARGNPKRRSTPKEAPPRSTRAWRGAAPATPAPVATDAPAPAPLAGPLGYDDVLGYGEDE